MSDPVTVQAGTEATQTASSHINVVAFAAHRAIGPMRQGRGAAAQGSIHARHTDATPHAPN